SARLRLPDDYGEAALQRKVHEVITTLDLDTQADQPVRSLSGGQRKRVSVGVELLSNPGLLFLDEPTAGQDPKNEQQMMQLFRRIANRGASVIINTHLLGSFGLLDRVAVLVGGKLAYFGPAPEMLTYFDCQQPQEVYYRLKDAATPEQWAERYRRSPQFHAYAQGALDEGAAPAARAPAPAAKPKHARLRQAATLLARQWSRKRKDRANLAALLLPPSLIAGLIGLMNWPHVASGARRVFTPDTPMSLFMLVLIALWFGCSATVRELVDEAAVYRRERQRDLNLSSYVGSKLAYLGLLAGAQSGLCIGVMLLLHVIAGHALAAWGWMWLLTIQGGLIGLLISALASSAEQALYAFPLVMIAELLFAGLLVPTAPLHPFYADAQVAPSGQVERLVMHDQPGWLPLVPPMPPRLRRTMAAVMVSRWGLEGVANLYSMDLGELPSCLDAQQSGAEANFCGYSLALTDLVAFTFRPSANHDARVYTAALSSQLGSPDGAGDLPQLPASPAETNYLLVQVRFVLLMVAAL
ncbi:MAG: ABC transporter permease, partial [Terriglobales bacterium]